MAAKKHRATAGKPAHGVWQWAVGLTLAAVVVIGLGLVMVLPSRTAARDQLIAGVVDRHVAALAGASPVEVVSTDRRTVKTWFQSKLPFTFDLPEVAGSAFTLVGGRMVYLEGQPGAHLLYDVRKHHLSVFILQEGGDFSRLLPKPAEPWRSKSFNVQSWSAGGSRYFVVSDAAPEEVSALAALFQQPNS